MDINQRQALMESLRNRVKKASSSVSTKVEAKKGDFSVVVTSDIIDHFYKGASVGTIRVSELDDDTIALINSDAQEAAQEMLDAFAGSFDVDGFDKSATTKEATPKEASQEKTAAHETLDDHTWQMTTQKQLDDQKPSLHPRTDDYPRKITQVQIPEDGQRPGTYEEITEAQFADETTTFYNKPLDGGKRILEDRNIVTEGQFEDGVSDYSDVGQSDRGEVGSKFDGDLAKQHKMIGEKQLAELLKHHEWTEPLTITEGKDQLGQQDGELSRITADVAEKIIREALNAMGSTVLAAGVTPENLSRIVKRLVSHPSKYPVLADTINRYADHEVSVINEKVAKAQYFGKVANTNTEWSDQLIADVLVRQLGKLSHNSQHVVDGIVALADSEDFTSRIDNSTNEILENKNEKPEEKENLNVFSQVLKGEHNKPVVQGSAEEDGLYEYTGTIEEIKVSTANRDEFTKAAAEYAINVVKENIGNSEIQLQPTNIAVDEELGTFKLQLKDASFKEAEKENLEARAETRRKLAKEAQFGGGGGAPPAGGPEMGNPMAPPGGADMGAAPPGEAFSQEPPIEDDMGMGGEMGGEPKPPGAICPVDGSEDVDVDNGEFRCNSCGAEGTIHVRLDVNKWPETISETGDADDEGFGLGAEDDQMLGDDLGGEPAPGGEGSGTTMPNVPIAASTSPFGLMYRITPRLLEKMAESKIELGSVCPNCGSNNTDRYKSANSKGKHGICYECLQEYNFQIKANPNKPNSVYAQHIWNPKTASESCEGCSRLRSSFVKSLGDYGMRMEEFERLAMKEKGEVILKMASSGTLSLSNESALPLNKYASSFKQKFDKFPSASCREKIARRFGENATAMSGPCQGKGLADCVCGQLEGLGIYTDGLAAKVAHTLTNKDPIINNPGETCVKMFMDENFSMKNACTICEGLRAAAATDEELVIESIAQLNPFNTPAKPAPKPMAAPTEGMDSPAPMNPAMPSAKPMASPAGGMAAPAPAPAMDSPAGSFMGDAPAPAMPGMEAKPMMGTPEMGMGGDMGSPEIGMGTPEAAPMEQDMGMGIEPNPMDEPVIDESALPVDDAGDGHLDVTMEGDLGDGLGDDLGMGVEGEEDLKTILIDTFQQLIDALQGNIGDDMIDTTGDELGEDVGGDELGIVEDDLGGDEDLDVGDVTDETVDDADPIEDDIPGVMNEDEGEEDILKEGEPEEAAPMEEEKHMEAPVKGKPMVEAPEEKVVIREKAVLPVSAEADEQLEKEASAAQLDGVLYRMKRGTISRGNDALDNLIDGLAASNPDLFKSAGKTEGDVKKMQRKEAKESKLTEKPAQDTSEIGKVKDNKTMGHEEPLGLSGPDVPRGDATIGEEDAEIKVNDSDRPTVPHDAPLMSGEEHYTPEKGNVVDGNQGGGQTTSAEAEEPTVKVAHTINQGHKIYDALNTRLSEGKTSVKLTDGKAYTLAKQDDSILLNEMIEVTKEAAGDCKGCQKSMKKCMCKEMEAEASSEVTEKEAAETENATTAQKNNSVKKESQTVSPKSVDKLEDDPDINPSSGPGAGKTHADEAHSLGVDEKKPSEGVSDPDVPEAPDGGQLAREHTYDNSLDGPEIPAGGGMNPDYDQDEKNTPEKLDQTLGKENNIAAMAETNRERATKIAGQMLKAQKISIDELPDKIAELAKASSAILDDYENMMKEASTKKGLQKAATVGSTETSFQLSSPKTAEEQVDLTNQVQSLFRLDQRNKDFEAHSGGNPRLWH